METKKVHIPYAIGTAVAMILVGVILKVTRLDDKPGMQWLGMLPFVAGIIMACIAYSKANDGFVTFGQVFGAGFKATAIITLIMIAWSFASLYIWPDMIDKAIEKAGNDMEKRGGMTQDQMDTALNFTRKNFKMLMVAGGLFLSLIMGTIFSLIGAAVAPKKGSTHRPEILDKPTGSTF